MSTSTERHPWVLFITMHADWQTSFGQSEAERLYQLALDAGLVEKTEKSQFRASFYGMLAAAKRTGTIPTLEKDFTPPTTMSELMHRYAEPKPTRKRDNMIRLKRLARMFGFSDNDRAVRSALGRFRAEYQLNIQLKVAGITVNPNSRLSQGELREFVKKHADFDAETVSWEIGRLYLLGWMKGKGSPWGSIEKVFYQLRKARRTLRQKHLVETEVLIASCKESLTGLKVSDRNKLLAILDILIEENQRLEAENRRLVSSTSTASKWMHKYKRLLAKYETLIGGEEEIEE